MAIYSLPFQAAQPQALLIHLEGAETGFASLVSAPQALDPKLSFSVGFMQGAAGFGGVVSFPCASGRTASSTSCACL